MAYSRKNSKKSSRKGSKRTYKRKSYASKKRTPLKRMIRMEIARNVENKSTQVYNLDKILYVSPDTSPWSSQNVFPLGPDPTSVVISQGTGQGQRVGNVIKTKKLTFKGTIVALPYDSIFNTAPAPVQLKMWIFYDRTDPTAVPAPITNFFQNGNTQKGFANDLVDMWSPVNTDRYTVLATKQFKLGFASATGSGSTAPQQYFSNNDFKYNCNFSFDLTKHYPKTVKFNDNTTTPTTRGLFCLVQYVAATGGQFLSGTRACAMQYMQDYVYEDA